MSSIILVRRRPGAVCPHQRRRRGGRISSIALAPLSSPGRAHWRDLVAHRAGVYILAFTVLADWLIRLERENGLPRIVVRRVLRPARSTRSPSPRKHTRSSWIPGFEFATDTLRFNYSSMTTPNETWDYHLAERTRLLRKRQEIPSGHDPADYVTRRLLAPAADGETVPISLLHRRDFKPDGTASGLVYGYGLHGPRSRQPSAPTARWSIAASSMPPRTARRHRQGLALVQPASLRASRTRSAISSPPLHLVAQGFVAPDRVVAQGGSWPAAC